MILDKITPLIRAGEDEKSLQLLLALQRRFSPEGGPLLMVPAAQADIREVAAWADGRGYLGALGVDETSAAAHFSRWLDEREVPPGLADGAAFREALQRVARNQAAERLPLRADEAETVKELILTGELFNDLAYTVARVFNLVPDPRRPAEIFSSITESLESVIGLPKKVASDFHPRRLSDDFIEQLQRIERGEAPDDPKVLDQTLTAVYAIPLINTVIGTASDLLAEENETLRIALLVYARLNGVNLEAGDIDEVRATVLDKDDPQLGRLLKYALENAVRLKG